jgi:tetratricopeptide (TPR) repeat protein
MHGVRRAICLAALLLPLPLAAQRTYSAGDLALLPSYCKYTQYFRDSVPGGKNPAEIERWMTITKGVFIHLHHYCWGLIASNRATFHARSAQQRARYLAESISEFDYVLQRSPPDFALLPEIYTRKGENLIRLGRGPHGEIELQRAIDLKTDYWPAYAALGDYYKSSGNLEKARQILEKGLAAAPDATALKERLGELAGPRERRQPDGK